jgi:Holliday junction resolvase RusA-like endonuclease
MVTVVEFTLDHVPVPASRPIIFRNGGSSYPKAHLSYHQFLKNHLGDKPLFPTGEKVVEVRFLFVMPPYKTSDHPTHRSDLDNLAKLPLDCMTGDKDKPKRYWNDDNLVIGLETYKRFARPGEEPHTKVKVTLLQESPEAYADRKFNG